MIQLPVQTGPNRRGIVISNKTGNRKRDGQQREKTMKANLPEKRKPEEIKLRGEDSRELKRRAVEKRQRKVTLEPGKITLEQEDGK